MAYGKKSYGGGNSGGKKKFEQKDGTGVLFVNDKKEKETHPDHTGNIMVNGTKYRLAAWLKKGNKGKYLSLAISEFNDTGRGSNSDDGDREHDENPFA